MTVKFLWERLVVWAKRLLPKLNKGDQQVLLKWLSPPLLTLDPRSFDLTRLLAAEPEPVVELVLYAIRVIVGFVLMKESADH